MHTLLFVDDSDGEIELCKISLRRSGMDAVVTIEPAFEVKTFKEVFDASRHEAVVIDWNLSDGAGTDVAKFIRETSEDKPIIFLSGCFTEEMMEEATSYNPLACLEKESNLVHLDKIFELLKIAQ